MRMIGNFLRLPYPEPNQQIRMNRPLIFMPLDCTPAAKASGIQQRFRSGRICAKRRALSSSRPPFRYSVMIDSSGTKGTADIFALRRHQAKSGGTSLRELLYNASMRKGWKPYIQCYGVPAASVEKFLSRHPDFVDLLSSWPWRCCRLPRLPGSQDESGGLRWAFLLPVRMKKPFMWALS